VVLVAFSSISCSLSSVFIGYDLCDRVMKGSGVEVSKS
jgi:hypothetical protein